MGIEASNQPLDQWLSQVQTGQLALPRFQRFESWSHGDVETLLDSVLRGRPIGAALVLKVGNNEPFVSRGISGAPSPTANVTEHLLDGQQRLTALWKALNDGYENRTYFAMLSPEAEDASLVRSFSRWTRKGRRYPLWVDQPEEQLSRGLVPMRLLNPAFEAKKIVEWCNVATESIEESMDVLSQVLDLQTTVRQANLPYLVLPVGTSPEEAIDVFIRMNTTAVKLSAFDIVVAQMEAATGQSLHDLEGSLRSAAPEAERYVEVPELVLRIAALREDRSPTVASFMRLDMQRLSNDWNQIVKGVEGAIGFLDEEHIFDRDRLPTVTIVPVLASIWSQMPTTLDKHGQARTLLRQYLWRSFFTDRYERAANTAALQDYRGLKSRLIDGITDVPLPVLDEAVFPIAEVGELKRAPWPKHRNTLARGILAVTLRGGGLDFAAGTPASRESLSRREYHHLFPASLLRNEGCLDESNINLALNCALVTWNTNRNISAKEPIAYLRERVEHATLGEGQIRRRFKSHIIPFDQLNVGGYSNIIDKEQRTKKIKTDYGNFIQSRAEAVHNAVRRLCEGEEWNGLEVS